VKLLLPIAVPVYIERATLDSLAVDLITTG